MCKKIYSILFGFCILMGASATLEADLPWLTDYKEASQLAEREGKPLLLYFTGSDWCVYCKKLDAQVFSQESFIQEVDGKYVFLLLDFPRYTSLSPNIKKQNNLLLNTFKVHGFPTLVVLSPKGKELVRTGYRSDLIGKAYAQYLQTRIQGAD